MEIGGVSMTKDDVIEIIKDVTWKDFGRHPDFPKAREAAIQALNEVEEYRAIGTLEECREAVKRNNEKTRIIDGITECCGYDFGTDAFQMELSKFCPVCGREIERGDEE